MAKLHCVPNLHSRVFSNPVQHTHAPVRAHVCACTHTYARTHAHTHARTNARTHTHARMHALMHIHRRPWFLSLVAQAFISPAFASSLGWLVSCSKDALVKAWDLDTQHCAQTLTGHKGEVWALDVDPTETRLITGGWGWGGCFNSK